MGGLHSNDLSPAISVRRPHPKKESRSQPLPGTSFVVYTLRISRTDEGPEMTTMTREISNHDDVIDSRDVIERAAELDELTHDKITIEERAELDMLHALTDQGEQATGDWQYGATLIRDSCFVEYAQQFAEDIGAIDENAPWPARHIDWEAAADELRKDYIIVEFDGVTYWTR